MKNVTRAIAIGLLVLSLCGCSIQERKSESQRIETRIINSENTEEDVYVDPSSSTSEVQQNDQEINEGTQEDKQDTDKNQSEATSIDLAGGSWGFQGERKDPQLPTEEDMQWAADLIDQYGTVLH